MSETNPPAKTIKEKFEMLQEAIFSRRPVLREIIAKHGSKTLYQYGQDYLDVNMNPTIERRRTDLLDTVYAYVERLLGKECAQSTVDQLKEYYFVSTADHHGPICHPFFLNANLITAAAETNHTEPNLKHVIVFSCGNVSLNNSSFPRGLLYSTTENNTTRTQRLSFLPSNAHAAAVHNFRPYTPDEVKKVISLINERERNKEISVATAHKLRDLVNTVYNRPEIFKCKDYVDQISITNHLLWDKFFESSPLQHPKLIYIEQENIVTSLLTKYHLDQKTAVHKILFDEAYAPLIDKYFEGIMGAYDRKEKRGTYMFWGVSPDKNFRKNLWKEGRYLYSEDRAIKIELTPEGIREALLEGKIIPSMLLIFIVLSFYYGLKCLGGFNQVNYLTFMKEAYLQMQTEMGDMESVEAVRRVQTKEFVDGPTIAFLHGVGESLVPAMGVDLVAHSTTETWQKIVDLAKTITLEEAFYPLLPEFYSVVYPEVERDKELSTVTSAEISEYTGIHQKIRACLDLQD